MWRSLFLSGGIMMIILGIECLMIESATVYGARQSSASRFVDPNTPPGPEKKVVKPADWHPWSLLSVGSVTCIYAVTIPRRLAGGGGEEG